MPRRRLALLSAGCVLIAVSLAASCAASDGDNGYISPIAEATGNPDLANLAEGRTYRLGDLPEFVDQLRQCMKTQGFTYVQEEQGPDIEDVYRGGLEPGSEQFIETLGFGVSTQMFHEESLPEDLVGFPKGVHDILASQQGPSGAQLLEGMTATEIDAYFDALYGDGGCFEQTNND